MKKAFRFIIVFLFFSASKLIAQIPETITKTDYTVAGSETLIASQSIVLKPNTWIKSGSSFVAKISPDAYIPITFSNENYIFSRLFQRALTNSSSIANNADVIESIVYYDGLGRPMQDIAIKASPSKKDIVTHISYDNFGRSEKEYLPYMDTSSAYAAYRSSAEINTNDYYKSNYSTDIDAINPNPFSQKEFEKSPLNRVLKQAVSGKDWAIGSGHEIKLDYLFNSSADGVKLYTVTTQLSVDGVYEPSVASYSTYAENELYKTVTKNENWVSGKNNTTEEFKDKLGKIILKRTYANYVNPNQLEVRHDTYYIYDTYGNLTYVLPPKADGAVTDAILKDICYQYKYDRRNRLVEKKIPGKDWEYIVYDKLDRPALTQDANLRASSKWMFTKYDAFNRPVYTGEYTNTIQTSRKLVQDEANKSTTLFETRSATATTIGTATVNYTNLAFPNPTTGIDLFTINYYDNYLNIDLDGGTSTPSYSINPITNPKGLNTCSKTRVLDTNSWITNVVYYDAKLRPIYNYNKNSFLDVVSTIKRQLDFGGKVLETTSTHKKGNNAVITLVDSYSYDHVGRMLTQKQTINNQVQEVIASNIYDNLGQLISKGVGGKINQSRLQNINYNYNIRGWLKGINNVNAIGTNLFAFQINYNTPTVGTPLYNGNISQTFWKTASTDSSLKNYTYAYDNLNRLTQATDNSSINPGRYNEGLSYDKNGNIMSLLRLGGTNSSATLFGTMDNLSYTYDTGNKLTKVEDTSGSTEGFSNGSNTALEYTYDPNGNMKTDANKGITAISYNHLNLPASVSIGSGIINYVYDVTGVKQRKTISTGGSTDYAGGFVYEDNNLKQFSQAEGYVVYNAGNYNYIYQYKDHLGNNRLSYQDKDNNGLVNSSEIVQESNYYAFGLTQKGYNSAINGIDNKYKYNGKELQDELGLNFYDYGARNYDPALGRWMNIDPLAEVSRRWSPYVYCYDNPVRFVDPDGMLASDPGDLYNLKGEHVGNDGVKNNAVYLVHTNSSQQLTQTESKHLVAGTLAPGLSPGPKVEQKEISNDELNLRASLSTLKQTEAGSANAPLDYNSWNMGDNFTEKSFSEKPSDYSKHPGMNTEGGGGSAAGAYQALERFYKGSDFSPKSQDASAVNNMTSSSFAAAKSGSGADFKTTTEGRWTSLKHFTAGGVQQLINNYRAQELKGSSTIATPVGELLKTRR